MSKVVGATVLGFESFWDELSKGPDDLVMFGIVDKAAARWFDCVVLKTDRHGFAAHIATTYT